MKTTHSRTKRKTKKTAFYTSTVGRVKVPIYKRKTPSGTTGFLVANYAGQKRRLDSYASEALAIEAADKLARQLSERHTVAATMTNAQAIEYAGAVQSLAPYSVSVGEAVAAVVGVLKGGLELSRLSEAAAFFKARNKNVTKKKVEEVVTDLLAVKAMRTRKGRPASARYLSDLKSRLNRFAGDFKRDLCDVTTAEIQEWLDGLKLQSQGFKNFRAVLHTLFEFGVRRGYASDNPVELVEKVQTTHGEIEIYSPDEMARLLSSAQSINPALVPVFCIGAFAGVRSGEIARLEWKDIDLVAGHIAISRLTAKTASRRIVPMSENLKAWLQPYAGREGKIWPTNSFGIYKAQKAVAAATATDRKKPVQLKDNSLRHSYASYRCALINDAQKVSAEMGHSPGVLHGHYRELVKPVDAEKWFGIMPEVPVNVVPLVQAPCAKKSGVDVTTAIG